MNRLKLDFALTTTEERIHFIDDYLRQITFTPTSAESETIANYILWGKDPKTGLNAHQTKDVQLPSKWSTPDPTSSLDALLENPNFNEAFLQRTENQIPSRVPRVVFSREETRASAPDACKAQYESLWRQIDEIDLTLKEYELAHDKHTETQHVRALRQSVGTERANTLAEKALTLTQHQYLRLKRHLVDLRQSQYHLRDSYTTPILNRGIMPFVLEQDHIAFDVEQRIAPCGLWYEDASHPHTSFFGILDPSALSDAQIAQLVHSYWRIADAPCAFDFRDINHVYQALLIYPDLKAESVDAPVTSTVPAFVHTLDFYITQARARLAPHYIAVLDLKLAQRKNAEIAQLVNSQFGKSYGENYISTIFTHKIVPTICAQAQAQEEFVLNLPYPENWKECRRCGRTLLANTTYFNKNVSARGGLNSACKRCLKEGKNEKIRKLSN